ncbi:MAG TPA: polysaccharide biosynthesis tyrosine autokinase [Actinomycetota bacterium]|nr:polysaccharide biosynthesis tyrosine autokinase [Actinomycetota bacterium]
MVEPDGPLEGGDIRLYLGILRRRAWSVVGVTAVAVASALAVSFTRTPVYESTARVQVKPPTANLLLQNVPVTSLVSLDTERQIATSTEVLERAATDLGLPTDPRSLEEFGRDLSVGSPTNTQILEITYAHPDPVEARRRAQAVAEAYLRFKTDQALDAAARVRRAIQEQLERVRARLSDAQARFAEAEPGSLEALQAQSEVESLQGEVAALQAQLGQLSILDISPGTIVQPANLPTEPASPNHLVNGGLALAMGLALGVGLAFLRERLDDRVHGRGDLERLVGAPVLATVPRDRRRHRVPHDDLAMAGDGTGPVAEAYRAIRTNLQVMARNDGVKVVAVVSARAGEQKTTTVANLGAALAQGGRRTVVVSCDLRRPRLHDVFGVPREPGLTDLLGSDLSLRRATHPTAIENLRVLPAGSPAGNTAEVLESDGMRAALARLREQCDFVILDTPPILAVADALPVAAAADGVLFLADAGTPREAVRLALDHLQQVGARVVGAAITNVDARRAGGGYYSYAYGYAYRYVEDGEARHGQARRRGAHAKRTGPGDGARPEAPPVEPGAMPEVPQTAPEDVALWTDR